MYGDGYFKQLLEMVIDKHAPLVQSKIRHHDHLWRTNEIQKKFNERDLCCGNHEKEKRMAGLCFVILEMGLCGQ